jgi:ATP adenylyltransferase
VGKDAKELLEFIRTRMRMSHIYQPVMVMELIDGNGTASIEEIAKAILNYDISQQEYYGQIVKNMPGRVLRKHGLVTRSGDAFEMPSVMGISKEEKDSLREACQQRLAEFLEKRGERIWAHRSTATGNIPGSLRYDVLKEAANRCELCGISSDERFLEVDHIVPRSKGGGDGVENLQALCWRCNGSKSNRDDADFRDQSAVYEEREGSCPFCDPSPKRILEENSLALVIQDAYPVSDDHALVIPKRHVASYMELTRPERNACDQLLLATKESIERHDSSVSGFNIGINDGEDAGQTVFHCHIHLIPRRQGDVETPRGGVRGVIPGKRDYGHTT